MKNDFINVIGAGLAGCEAAHRAASLGCRVRLFEMKPEKYSPAHSSPGFAELVCSNSLRSDQPYNAVGLLKDELRTLGSLIMEAAEATRVPAGASLAVDRDGFSAYITKKIRDNASITVIEGEVTQINPEEITVIATGPLTSEAFANHIRTLTGEEYLHFFDAAAPIVDAESVDAERVFLASRYGKGEAAYVNCPMTRGEYDDFYRELINAEQAVLHDFEKNPAVFEGCMPVEVMARRGYETLLYGPLKPVGLTDPRTGHEPFAVVQLRFENNRRTMYNLVGFQTHLTFPEQRRVFGLIPGLENARYLRYGVMHRNTFINSPQLLTPTYAMRKQPNIFFAGQLTGVEGYVESAASGLVAGENAAALCLGREATVYSPCTVIGSMAHYISDSRIENFQPMNANFGIIAPPEGRIKGGKRARADYFCHRSKATLDELTKRKER